ncbi:hypothetical protein HX140_004364 [Salmonella enterica]|nr:hypothetical protein [Salmonella enterica]
MNQKNQEHDDGQRGHQLDHLDDEKTSWAPLHALHKPLLPDPDEKD